MGVSFTEYNVAVDAGRLKEMIDKSGQMGVPVITVDDKVLVGYDPAELEKMLA
ncbi:MAG: glutaredoxin family protein [Bacteroidetes bacterium]|nr:glutaredoxin family protein [Bacteroidota bacterium]MCL5026321.1 glutaredoxin family protein [Chloroflexota bacterium]